MTGGVCSNRNYDIRVESSRRTMDIARHSTKIKISRKCISSTSCHNPSTRMKLYLIYFLVIVCVWRGVKIKIGAGLIRLLFRLVDIFPVKLFICLFYYFIKFFLHIFAQFFVMKVTIKTNQTIYQYFKNTGLHIVIPKKKYQTT